MSDSQRNISISNEITSKHLDVFSGAKRRSMFFSLMRVFRKISVSVIWRFNVLFKLDGYRIGI